MTHAQAALRAIVNGWTRGRPFPSQPRFMLVGAELYDAYHDGLFIVWRSLPAVRLVDVPPEYDPNPTLMYRATRIKRVGTDGWWAKIVDEGEFLATETSRRQVINGREAEVLHRAPNSDAAGSTPAAVATTESTPQS